MVKHLLFKAHKAQMGKSIELDVTLKTGRAGDEQALAVLKKKASHGVIVASYSD
jgi:hypothetical protein